MMELTVLVVTYNRKGILSRTLNSIKEHLLPDNIVVADDGSTDGTQDMLKTWYPDVILVQSDRLRLGGNSNAGLRVAFELTDVVLHTQDDYFLTGDTGVREHIKTLEEDENCGWIRIGQSFNHDFVASLHGEYWRVSWDSPGLYIASDQPHLKHRRFHDTYGWYPEGLPVGDTENSWCGRVKAEGQQKKSPQVYVPLYFKNKWLHLDDGHSFNLNGL